LLLSSFVTDADILYACFSVTHSLVSIYMHYKTQSRIFWRSGHTERGLPQRTAVSVRCGRPRSVWPDLKHCTSTVL